MPNQPSHHTINLNDQAISYQLKKGWRNRYVRLTIHPQKGLVVSAPKLYPRGQIEKFIQQKQDWIHSKLKILRLRQENIFQFGHGEMVTLLGNDLKVHISETDEVVPKVTFPSTFMKLRDFSRAALQGVRNDKHILSIESPLKNLKTAEQHFFKWLKRFTYETISERVHFYSQKHRLQFNKVTIKNQQSLWGSCSTKKNLNFSKRLIQYPIWMIDYVVCHELAHLTHMNHSQKFWNQVREYFPDYKKARRHLKVWKPNIVLQ